MSTRNFIESPCGITVREAVTNCLCIVDTEAKLNSVLEYYLSALGSVGFTKAHHLFAFFHNLLDDLCVAALREQWIVPWSLLEQFSASAKICSECAINEVPPTLYDVRIVGDLRFLQVEFKRCAVFSDVEYEWRCVQYPKGQMTEDDGIVVGKSNVLLLNDSFLSYFVQVKVTPRLSDRDGDQSALAPVYAITAQPIGSWRIVPRTVPAPQEFRTTSDHLQQHSFSLTILIEHYMLIGLERLMCAVPTLDGLLIPLQMACNNNRIDVVQMLINYAKALRLGSDQEIVPSEEIRSVSELVTNCLFNSLTDIYTLKLLIFHGAKVNKIRDSKGNSLLHIVAHAGDLTLGKALINAGADPNVQNLQFESPLHVCVRNQDLKFTSLLLMTAQVSELNRNAALKCAGENQEMMLLLLQHSSVLQIDESEKGIIDKLTMSNLMAFSIMNGERGISEPSWPNAPNALPFHPALPLVAPHSQSSPPYPYSDAQYSPLAASISLPPIQTLVPTNQTYLSADERDVDLADKELALLNQVGTEESFVGLRVPQNDERNMIVSLYPLYQHTCRTVYVYYCGQYGVKPNKSILNSLPDSPNLFNINKFVITDYIMVGNRGLLPLLEVLRVNISLKVFSARNNGITNVGVEWLAHALIDHPSINAIDLSFNDISNGGGSCLLYLLQNNNKIVTVNVNNTKVNGSIKDSLNQQCLLNNMEKVL